MSNKEIPYKIYLEENEMPDSWYNVRADMKKKPAPLLNPATLEPLKPEELEPVFCKELVKQELNDTDAYIPIPQEIKDFYKMYRPSPLVRAYCLEKKLGTPAKIYYKFEGNAPDYLEQELKACADMADMLGNKMFFLNQAITKIAEEQAKEKEAAKVAEKMKKAEREDVPAGNEQEPKDGKRSGEAASGNRKEAGE